MMAFLMLADGTCFTGESVGAKTHRTGEVVFNTAHLGYQEILTDPSYHGQIINFTAAHIGNVGINSLNYESEKIHAFGALFRAFSPTSMHWQAQEGLSAFLTMQGIPALAGVDTRALTIYLRDNGCQSGCLVTDGLIGKEEAQQFALAAAKKPPDLFVMDNPIKPYTYQSPATATAHIVVVDCGIKTGILRALSRYNARITIAPQNISFAELQQLHPDGVLLSNGPGDPRDCKAVIQLARHLLQERIPVFGICLGHQILALAAGAAIEKMKFGHHGANHPIQCSQSKTVFISSQNHGYVVAAASLPTSLHITHRSLFDGTIAGIKHLQAPAFSFQGHPEANPGPRELTILFDKFIHMVHHAEVIAY